MAGWLTTKFSTIFKSPYMLYWKERSEGKRIVSLVIHLRRHILQTIPEDVMKKHEIDKALRFQDKAEEEAKTIDKKGFRLAFNVEIDEVMALDLIGKIENAFIKARKKHRSLGTALDQIELEFQKELARTLNKCEEETKEIYWHQLEPIIKVAEKPGNHNALMANVAQMFKTKESVSILASWAFRWEARGLRKNLINLRRDERQIENVLAHLDKKGVNPERVAIALSAIVKRITEHAKNEFRNAYVLWKRDFLLNLVLLRLLDIDEANMREFVQNHLMPSAPEMKNISDIEEIKKDVAKNCHVLAQGYRILVGKLRELAAIVRREEAAARARK